MKRPVVCVPGGQSIIRPEGASGESTPGRKIEPGTPGVPCRRPVGRGGFSLVEVLVATVLTLIIMAAVVSVFASISSSISQSRSTLEMTDRIRTTASQLKRDLEGVTVTMMPPRRPETNEGYFEYIEGPVGPVFMPETLGAFIGPNGALVTACYAMDTDRTLANAGNAVADSTVGDNDDILMFTTRAKDRPFVGKIYNSTVGAGTIESWVAEVAWFVRGRTLYRRVLLVAPSANLTGAVAAGYYATSDVSAHVVVNGSTPTVVPNSLGDLTRREYRYAHPYNPSNLLDSNWPFPYDVRVWGQFGLPTLRESAANNSSLGTVFTLGTITPKTPSTYTPPYMSRDFWSNPYPWVSTNNANWNTDPLTGTMAVFNDPNVTRIIDDVVLTNVVGFDVKAWDPGAPVLQYTVSANTNPIILMPGDPYYTALMAGTVTWGNNVTVAYYGAYVDLGWNPAQIGKPAHGVWTPPTGAPLPSFGHLGQGTVFYQNNAPQYLNRSGLVASYNPNSGVVPPYWLARVYDTYSLHYEYDGLLEIPPVQSNTPPSPTAPTVADLGTNGADDYDPVTGIPMNGVDDPGEAETCPPYPTPLRGIQVKIRAMDPDSGQVREVTVVQEFLPQ